MTPDAIWDYCRRKHYSAAFAAYWGDNTRCEACEKRQSATPHHIRTRGSGGDDSDANLLALCAEDHSMIGTMGRSAFCKRFPHLKKKVDAAMERSRA